MKIKSKERLDKFSFIHYKVTDVCICPNTKSIRFSISGASYLDNNVRKDLSNGYFKIEHFESINISSYDAVTKETKEIEIGDQEKMIELCEIEYVNDNLVLKGFADKSSHWLEFEIKGGVLEGDFTELE